MAALIGIVIGTLIGALLLLVAIALYNMMAGGTRSPNSVPAPTFGKAMGITLLTSVVNYAIQYLLTQVGLALPGGLNGLLILGGISVAISLLVMALMLTTMLPTSFGRALLVTLCYLLICIIIGVAIGAAIMLAFGVKFF